MRQFPVIIVASLMCAGCLKPGPTIVTVRGVTYVVPPAEVETQDLTTQGRVLVRAAPGGAFHLILDEFFPYLPNRQGPNIPTISTLNDNRFGKFEVIASADGPIICDLGPMPHFNCGISIDDGPVRWSVVFDRDQLNRVTPIRREARATIVRYRRSAA